MKEHFPATIKFLSKFKPAKKVLPSPTTPFDSLGWKKTIVEQLDNLDLTPGSVNYIKPGTHQWYSKALLDALYPDFSRRDNEQGISTYSKNPEETNNEPFKSGNNPIG